MIESHEREQICQTGAQISVYWGENELEGAKWKEGWYDGETQGYDDDNDELAFLDLREEVLHRLSLTMALADEKIKLNKAVI